MHLVARGPVNQTVDIWKWIWVLGKCIVQICEVYAHVPFVVVLSHYDHVA